MGFLGDLVGGVVGGILGGGGEQKAEEEKEVKEAAWGLSKAHPDEKLNELLASFEFLKSGIKAYAAAFAPGMADLFTSGIRPIETALADLAEKTEGGDKGLKNFREELTRARDAAADLAGNLNRGLDRLSEQQRNADSGFAADPSSEALAALYGNNSGLG